MGSVNGDFVVKVGKKEVVAAVLPFQEHWLPFTNLDLLLPPLDVGLFFCYKKPVSSMSYGSMVSILKKALAQALVSYYAFAGEVVPNALGEPELLCNNRGVDFIEAYADIELQYLNFYNPDESIQGKFVPKKKNGVLSVQATELKCGGIVLAFSFDHRVADAYSANMFIVSLTEMVQSKPVSIAPSFRRSLLNPRRPGLIDSSIDEMYVPIPSLPPPEEKDEPSDHLISRIYYVTADQLNEIQSVASSNGDKRTKLESFSAFLWKMVATFAGKDNDKVSKLGIVVDGRSRLGEGDEDKATLINSHFGNVLSIPYGSKTISELIEMPLSCVAKQVHDFLKPATTKEHFLGLIDWVEGHRPEPAMTRVYCVGKDDGPALVVSSGQRFPITKVDFGWGCPTFGSYHFPWGGLCGYVMPMPSSVRDGDWVVYMHLLKGQLELIEKEAANVFRPLTFDYLNL
ncbi:hypothetical protein DITRI_Ditri19aG0131200 [Diplodiscus trichospermus]